MRFLKSVLSGLAALIVTALVMCAPFFVWVFRHRYDWGYSVAIDWHFVMMLCIAILAFCAGFLWQYRRRTS